jgi:hypothetical protein
MEPFREIGKDIPECLFVGCVRRLCVKYLGYYLGSAVAIAWGAVAFVCFLPLLIGGYVLGPILEVKYLGPIVLVVFVLAYPVAAYIYAGRTVGALVASALVLVVLEVCLRD